MKSVNPNAQREVNNVLDYLEKNRGKKIILGQHTQTMQQKELEYIRNITGRLPALCGFELLAYSPNIRYDISDDECLDEVNMARGTLKKAWEWAEKGGLITFTWHWFSPLGGCGKSFFSKNTDFDAALAVKKGTPENTALISDMDYMAGLLRPFCDAHIPILWRPFHENEGDWFWWGNCAKDTVRALFRIMYERYVEHFHLDNLIWVFNSTEKECYPGDDITDIVTRDMYPPAHEHGAHADMIDGLRKMTDADKLFAIAETGTLPDVRAVIEQNIPWSWYMTWSNEFGSTDMFTSEQVLKDTYEYENSITLDRLERLY